MVEKQSRALNYAEGGLNILKLSISTLNLALPYLIFLETIWKILKTILRKTIH